MDALLVSAISVVVATVAVVVAARSRPKVAGALLPLWLAAMIFAVLDWWMHAAS